MAKILCVGIATLDIVNKVASYPAEDEEIRILAQEKCRGGNATNTAVILSQLGHDCYWAGTLVNEIDSQTIIDDLNLYDINTDYCRYIEHGKVPTSYITLSQENGTRTICHYRDLPEYQYDDFKSIELSTFDWIHFEGRNISETLKMLTYCQDNVPDIPISIEIEKNRDNIESLVPFANLVLYSRQFALSQGYPNAQSLCEDKKSQYQNTMISCAWGEFGAGAGLNQDFFWQPATSVIVIDSLGAGDVFNAGLINHLTQEFSLKDSLAYACELATLKCTQKGFNLNSTLNTNPK